MNPEEVQRNEAPERIEEKKPAREGPPYRERRKPHRSFGVPGYPEEQGYRDYGIRSPHPREYARTYPPQHPGYLPRPRRGYGFYPSKRMRFPEGSYAPVPYRRGYEYDDYNEWPPRYMPGRPYHRYPKMRPLDPEPASVLGIFGLDIKIHEEELAEWIRSVLAEEIELKRVELILDKYTGFSRGFAFAYFETVEDAKKAKERLTGQICNGSAIRIEYSITAAGHKKEEVVEQAEKMSAQ